MTYTELKNKINNVVETIKGQTNISGYKLNVVLNDLLNFINNNSPTKNYYEMRLVVTDTTGSGGQLDIISEYGDAALLDLGLNKPVLNRITFGTYQFMSVFSLANAQVLVGSIEGVVEMTGSAIFKTKTITDDGSNNIVFTDSDDLLNKTNIILTVPKSVVDALGV